jgi:outer membrane protein
MKKVLAAAVVAASLPQAASALPLVDFYAGGYYWDQSVSGDVGSGTTADLDKDLKLDGGGQNVLYFAFEHPVPVLPNIKIKSSDMSADGDGSISANFQLGGETALVSQDVSSKLDLTHTDYTLYWGLPLPVVTLDFGLTARQFDGSMSVDGDLTFNGSADLDVVVPMGYLKAGVDIPLTGLSLGADLNIISYGDSGITDFDINLNYVLPVIPVLDVGITAGYRSFDLELDPEDFGGDSDDLTANAKVAGPYLGLSLHL